MQLSCEGRNSLAFRASPLRLPLPSLYYRPACLLPTDQANPDRERIVSAVPLEDDSSFELKLRPQRLREFIGQKKVKDNLEVAIQAAKSQRA